VIVYAVVDDTFSPDFPLGDAVETFIRLEDAERFIAEVRGDKPEMRRSARRANARLRVTADPHALCALTEPCQRVGTE
jgi:hypothetical protein